MTNLKYRQFRCCIKSYWSSIEGLQLAYTSSWLEYRSTILHYHQTLSSSSIRLLQYFCHMLIIVFVFWNIFHLAIIYQLKVKTSKKYSNYYRIFCSTSCHIFLHPTLTYHNHYNCGTSKEYQPMYITSKLGLPLNVVYVEYLERGRFFSLAMILPYNHWQLTLSSTEPAVFLFAIIINFFFLI